MRRMERGRRMDVREKTVKRCGFKMRKVAFSIAICIALAIPAPRCLAQEARAPAVAADAPTCELEPGPSGAVARVIDGETVALDDGRELRLAGILVPRARDAGAAEGGWPLEEAAHVALADLVLGKPVQIAFGSAKSDRYGRIVGHLFTMREGMRQWIEGELLGRGLARASALPGDGVCLTELLAHERLARTDVSGVWRLRFYAPKASQHTGALLAARSSFQIVRGRVEAVGRTKTAVYLNFGKDWRTDFTVRIPRSVLRQDEAWARSLDGLKDRIVEVRGWIERRNGPMISIAHRAELIVPGQDDELPEPTISQRTPSGANIPAPATAREPDGAPATKNRPEQGAPGDLDL